MAVVCTIGEFAEVIRMRPKRGSYNVSAFLSWWYKRDAVPPTYQKCPTLCDFMSIVS